MRERAYLYRRAAEAADHLPPEVYKEWMQAIIWYTFDGVEPEGDIGKAALGMIRDQIDADRASYNKVCDANKKNRRQRNDSSRTVTNGDEWTTNGSRMVDESSSNGSRMDYEWTTNGSRMVAESESESDSEKEKPCPIGQVKKKDDASEGLGMDKSASHSSKDKSGAVYPYDEVVAYLNSKAGTAFRPESKDTRRLIRARIDSGFTLDDFRTVIDRKVSQWKTDPRMSAYLRPVTLFGTKFEAYLNERGGGRLDWIDDI